MSIDQRNPNDANPVSSFESGIITLDGVWIGVCLKLVMYDRCEKLMHWPPDAFRDLMTALKTYAETLGHSAFMLRAKTDPNLVVDLPLRHPYHTLLTEAPKISLDEIGRPSAASSVASARFVVRGPTFEVRPVYSDDHTECIFFHEYTALSMLCYLEQYLEAAEILSGPAAGNA